MLDEYTQKPINICIVCGAEVIGWLDNPEEPFICEKHDDTTRKTD